ncbi:hypothetical protein ANCCAN_06959 [Ancylostoma caninum]|uniref:Uncharacterized protein n=1 Tax=Ancylostoma caninum TaxID=29170 RepID=A0A368GTV3_ANCCA|nr:hypothetical protein ANCCAN_06959 [Ancylostoma caninum]
MEHSVDMSSEQKNDEFLSMIHCVKNEIPLPATASKGTKAEIAAFASPDEVSEYKAQLISALHLAWSNAAEHARAYKAKMKAQYDKAARLSQIREGDRVFFKNYTNKQGLARKLCFRQFRVLKIEHPHATIVSITEPTSKPRRVHINQIKTIVDYSGPSLTPPTVPQEEFVTELPEEVIHGYSYPQPSATPANQNEPPPKPANNMADSFNTDEDSRTSNTSVTSTEGPSQVQSLIAPPDHEQQEDDKHDVHMENNDDAENQAVDLQPPPTPPPNEETIRKSNTDQQVPTPVTSLRRQDPRYCPNICADSSDDDEELQWYKPRSRQSSPESEPTRELPVPYHSITSSEGSTPKNYGTYAGRPRDYSRSPSECDYPIKKSKVNDEVAQTLSSLVEQASLNPPEPAEEGPQTSKTTVTYKPQEHDLPHKALKTSREYESFHHHPWASMLKVKPTPIVSPYYDTSLDVSTFEK